MNPFLEVVREAQKQGWCIEPYCTTCGSMDFRRKLDEIGGPLGGPLATALSDIDLDELMSLQHWQDVVEIAFVDLQFHWTDVLKKWLDRAEEDIRFFDWVLYRFARKLREENPLRDAWVKKGITLAIELEDFSLVETLILTMGRKAKQHPELIKLAAEFARESKQMQRVLRNACGIEVD